MIVKKEVFVEQRHKSMWIIVSGRRKMRTQKGKNQQDDCKNFCHLLTSFSEEHWVYCPCCEPSSFSGQFLLGFLNGKKMLHSVLTVKPAEALWSAVPGRITKINFTLFDSSWSYLLGVVTGNNGFCLLQRWWWRLRQRLVLPVELLPLQYRCITLWCPKL